MNGLFDVDPRVGSTAIPGFTELMALYQNYRVDNCQITADVVNNETFAVEVAHGASANVPFTTNNFSSAFFGNKRFKKLILSAAGGMDRGRCQDAFSMPEQMGTSAYWGDLANFVGTSASNPGTALFWNIGLEAPVVFVNGVELFLEMEFIVEWSNIRMFQN